MNEKLKESESLNKKLNVTLNAEQLNKEKVLEQQLEQLKKVAVAFSGGVDSTLVLCKAVQVLGSENVLALTGDTQAMPRRELEETKRLCKNFDVSHIVFKTGEMNIDGFKNNPQDRCYLCKSSMLNTLIQKAKEQGFEHILDGSNADDAKHFRPGSTALEEHNIISPLAKGNFSKADVRAISYEHKLSTWNKPSFSCLYTRFEYGAFLDSKLLKSIEELEQILLDIGFSSPRVRMHKTQAGKTIARIEVEQESFEKLLDIGVREHIINACKTHGFEYVCFDLEGFRSGSMDI